MTDTLISSTRELRGLPDGTLITPTDDCALPRERWEGVTYLKNGSLIYEQGPSRSSKAAILLGTFKDLLPARVIGHQTITVDDVFGTVFAVGERVLPEDFREYEHALRDYDLRITHVYKNGNIRAATPNGDAVWSGPSLGFYRPEVG